MFDFFCFKDEDKHLDFTFPLQSLDSYQCFLKGMNAKNWLGRSVYLIASISGFASYILPISELFEKFLNSRIKVVEKTEESLSPFFDRKDIPFEEEIFDNATEEQAKSDGKDEGAALDDGALARQLQEEEYSGGLDSQLSVFKDDEQLARELQEKIENDWNKKDEEFARKMQNELHGDTTTVISSHLSKPSTLALEDQMVFEEERAAHTLEDATYQILNTSGLEAEEDVEDGEDGEDGEDPTKKIITYDFLSSKFRAITAALTKEYPQAMSLTALKAQREVNIEQYLALKLKQFSHIEEIKGTVSLPSGKLLKLEGFFDSLAAPMLIGAYDMFSETSRLFDAKDKSWVFAQLNQIIFADYISPKEVQSLVEDLQSPDFIGPAILSTGFEGHCAAVGWLGDFMFYIDRGCFNAEPGVSVFYVPNRELITESFVREIVEKEDIEEKDYRMIENILSQINAELVHYEPRKAQKVGNCTKATLDTCLDVLMASRILLNNHSKVSDIKKGTAWKRAFDKINPVSEKFNAYERKLIFDDMINEIEEWLGHTTSFGKLNLKKMYQDVLTYWLYAPYAKRAKSAVKKVRDLLAALEKGSAEK